MAVVYKITSPTGRIYVGSTKNFLRRLDEYKRGGSKGQVKLHYSLQKYGFESHTIEIILECEEMDMLRLEAAHGIANGVLGPNGLNLKLPKLSDEYSCITKETRDRMSKGRLGIAPYNKGIPMPEAQKKLISAKHKGKSKNYSPGNKGIPMTEEQKRKLKGSHGRIVMNTENGVFYRNVPEAMDAHGITKYKLLKSLSKSFVYA